MRTVARASAGGAWRATPKADLTEHDAAIRLKPGDANAHHNRAFAYAQKGRFNLAIRDYVTAAFRRFLRQLLPELSEQAKLGAGEIKDWIGLSGRPF